MSVSKIVSGHEPCEKVGKDVDNIMESTETPIPSLIKMYASREPVILDDGSILIAAQSRSAGRATVIKLVVRIMHAEKNIPLGGQHVGARYLAGDTGDYCLMEGSPKITDDQGVADFVFKMPRPCVSRKITVVISCNNDELTCEILSSKTQIALLVPRVIEPGGDGRGRIFNQAPSVEPTDHHDDEDTEEIVLPLLDECKTPHQGATIFWDGETDDKQGTGESVPRECQHYCAAAFNALKNAEAVLRSASGAIDRINAVAAQPLAIDGKSLFLGKIKLSARGRRLAKTALIIVLCMALGSVLWLTYARITRTT